MSAGPITFDYAAWEAMFPEMVGVSEPAANGYFNMATLYVRNDGCGPIQDPNMLMTVLYLTTAHIAKLFSMQTNGVPTTGGTSGPSQVVGRVSNASEGSVSAGLEMPDQPAQAAWWNQTIYGAAVWKALAPFRTARYIGPTRRRLFNYRPGYWGNLGGGGWGGL